MNRSPAPHDGAGTGKPAVTASSKVIALAAVLATVGVIMIVFTPDAARPLETATLWVPVLIGAGFFLSERYVFRIESRRQAIDVSLSEVPSAFALVFLPPVLAVAVRMAGSIAARATRERVNWLKVTFNTALFIFEPALANFLLRSLFDTSDPVELLFGSAFAISAGSCVGGAAVALAIGTVEGDLAGRMRLGFSGLPVYLLGALMGAASVAPALLDDALALLALLPCVVVWRLLTHRGMVAQRYRDLLDLHEFTGAINSSSGIREIVESASSEVRRLMRAEGAALVALDPMSGAEVHTASTSPDATSLPREASDTRWERVMNSEEVVRLDAARASLPDALLASIGWKDALAISIRDSSDIVGLLVVADRSGSLARFTGDDLARMRPLANQLSVSLRKGLLHERMEYEATHDRLTGLPNRSQFERLLDAELAGKREVGVLLLDLDRFKEVNDGLGHHMGDALLQQFARRIALAVGGEVTVSRLAGDEFALMCPGGAERVRGVGIAVVDASRQPFDLGELSVGVSCSVGMALAPAHGQDAATLLRRADMAMYEAKNRSSGLECYVPEMDSQSADRLSLLRDLRVALVDGQMQAYFQPKVDLRTDEVVGAEALVRWHHPERGLLDAESFIGLAEQTDVIHALTDHVLGQALEAAAQWLAAGWEIGVAVNVSARSLLDELLADRVGRQLSRHRVPPGMLTLEITETSMLSDAGRAIATLDRLRDLGVCLSVDDFGTGYSSLTYLHRLPVTELKIDRTFVGTMQADPHDLIIVRSIVDLGRHLQLRVVAEGIEDEATATKLRDLGCDVGQGIWAARPLPLADLFAWLERRDLAARSSVTSLDSFRRA